MVETITRYYCDICKKEVKQETDLTSLQVPVFMHYDDTEFKSCSPYIEYKDLDICPKCVAYAITIDSYMPNQYEFSR